MIIYDVETNTMEAFWMSRKGQVDLFFCVFFFLVGYTTHTYTHFSLTHKYIAFPLLRPYRVNGVVFVTFGSFPHVQNIQKTKTQDDTSKLTKFKQIIHQK